MKIFIDGQAGTTGLQLYQRLQNQENFQIINIAEQYRKERCARLELYRQADIVVLCLPDDEAKEMVELTASYNIRFLDASSAHRCTHGWVYGLPELSKEQPNKIAQAQRVANPGCYASACLLLLKPLIDEGLLLADTSLNILGFSGYSGGGRQLIERYEEAGDWQNTPLALYALDFKHRHLAEIMHWGGLAKKPFFLPSVINCAQGMLLHIPINRAEQLQGNIDDVEHCYRKAYAGAEFVKFNDKRSLVEEKFLQLKGWQNRDHCSLELYHDEDFLLLVALLDNLGKGASGVALQNLRLMAAAKS